MNLSKIRFNILILFSLLVIISALFAVPVLAGASEQGSAVTNDVEKISGAKQEDAGVISLESKEIEYELPYTGILPDHPLYMLKQARDKVWLFIAREPIKKAELLLHISDKKAAMASLLSQKGAWSKSVEIMLESENDFHMVFEYAARSEEIGAAPTEDFIQKMKLSNQKHRQIIEDLLASTPDGERKVLEEVLKQNEENKKAL